MTSAVSGGRGVAKKQTKGTRLREFSTGWMEWMSHWKRKETRKHPGTVGPGNILGCCLVSLRFLCDIHSIHCVQGRPRPQARRRLHPRALGPARQGLGEYVMLL